MNFQFHSLLSSELQILPILNFFNRPNLKQSSQGYNTEKSRPIRKSNTQATSLKMGKLKDLEYLYWRVARKILENGILINWMAVERLNIQMGVAIGGHGRIARRKGLECRCGLMGTDTSGSGGRMRCMGMEYTGGQTEQYIMESGK
jgi:hypothetical protein